MDPMGYKYLNKPRWFPAILSGAELRPCRGAGELLVLRAAALAAPELLAAGLGGGTSAARLGALRHGRHPK